VGSAPGPRGSDPDDADRMELLRRAKEGDGEAREALIAAYVPFVLRVASSVAGRYLRLGEDDEASVGLMAFNEAIDSYRSGQGASFLNFSEVVVRRRVIDHLRRERRPETPVLDAVDDEERDADAARRIEAEEAHERFRRAEEARARREEILRYRALLEEYSIGFEDLVKASPKHRDARESAQRVAGVLASRRELVAYLRERKALPLRQLERLVDVSRKTLERQRKYIIAVALILVEGFEELGAYVCEAAREAGEVRERER